MPPSSVKRLMMLYTSLVCSAFRFERKKKAVNKILLCSSVYSFPSYEVLWFVSYTDDSHIGPFIIFSMCHWFVNQGNNRWSFVVIWLYWRKLLLSRYFLMSNWNCEWNSSVVRTGFSPILSVLPNSMFPSIVNKVKNSKIWI